MRKQCQSLFGLFKIQYKTALVILFGKNVLKQNEILITLNFKSKKKVSKWLTSFNRMHKTVLDRQYDSWSETSY